MKQHIRTAALFAAVAATLSAGSVAAQSPIAGAWNAEVARRVENVNGVETASEVAIVRFTFEVRGDSVFGTSQLQGGSGNTAARKLRGTYQDGVLKLVGEPVEAIMRTQDGESRIQMVTSYDLKLEGDALTGTQQSNSVDGIVQSQQRPFKATRAKT